MSPLQKEINDRLGEESDITANLSCGPSIAIASLGYKDWHVQVIINNKGKLTLTTINHKRDEEKELLNINLNQC